MTESYYLTALGGDPIILNSTDVKKPRKNRGLIKVYGGERVPHRHIATLKPLQPLLALVSYETDEEQY